VVKIVGNLWAVGAPPQTPLGELTALPSWWGGVATPSPRIRPPLSAFGLASLVENPGHAPAWVQLPLVPTHESSVLAGRESGQNCSRGGLV